jgi:hypothetical protein
LGRDIFQQRKCWLEELREYVKRKDSIICGAGCMSLPAITEEITEAAADPRPHTRQQRYDWKSRARDLDDTRAWLGRQLRAQVEPAASEVSRAITTDLLTPKPNGKVDLDDSKRPLVLAKVQALATLLERDHTISAAWQYLVAACQSSDHSLYPTERVKFLRDTVVALCSRREQDLGPFGPIHTAVAVLLGSEYQVRRALHPRRHQEPRRTRRRQGRGPHPRRARRPRRTQCGGAVVRGRLLDPATRLLAVPQTLYGLLATKIG